MMHRARSRDPIRSVARIALALLLCWSPARTFDAAAQSRPYAGSVSLNVPFRTNAHLQRPASSHYDVVALRVEFQPDSSRFSTGDGTFDGPLFPGVDPPRIDPLPHDAAYFAAHLSFLENYIRRVSDGRTTVTSHLLPVVVRVSGHMADYAPIGPEAASDAQLGKLASLVEEAWTRAGALDSFEMPSGLDPAHTAFLLFHAGVGRDIELLGTTLDKTPEDLPSLYFDESALNRLLEGFDVSVDGFPVTNTLLIPRTESRRGIDFIADEPFLAELSINGMLAANFLSYLGVPDLFNTATGESAIGPFGVMDGLGIFAYGGLLPPEPTAWTKWFLGWADVQTPIQGSAEETVELAYSGSSESNAVFLAPISENEFFLVENRNRDPEGDGLNLTVWDAGELYDVHFDHGVEGFNGYSTTAFPGGVVVDADNLDFALPGGLDSDGNTLVGGILVWHIDEARLVAGLGDNSVNADPEHRSVDLEEADGAQDIGYPGQGFFGPSFDLGSPYDFFYAGNPTVVVTPTGSEVRLYENRFGPATYPSSASNAGGSSFIEMDQFSVPGSEMSFVFRRVSERGLTPRDDVSFSFELGDPAPDTLEALYYLRGVGVDFAAFGTSGPRDAELVWSKGGVTTGLATGLFDAIPVQSEFGLTALGPDGFYRLDESGVFGLSAPMPAGADILRATTPMVELLNGRLYVGAEDAAGSLLLSAYAGVVTIERLDQPLLSLAVVDGLREARIYDDHTVIPSLQRRWDYDSVSGPPDVQGAFARYYDRAAGTDASLLGVIPDPAQHRLILLREDGTTREVRLSDFVSLGLDGSPGGRPVLADLDDDHRPDILVQFGNRLIALNMEGAVVDGFPIVLRAASKAQLLLIRTIEDGPIIALVSANDGHIDAYDLASRNHRVPGFPLAAAVGLASTPAVAGRALVALSTGGAVTQWDFDETPDAIWAHALSERNSSFIEIASPIPTGGFEYDGLGRVLFRDETYNWPNPIRDGTTWIRFKPRARCDVEITIVDFAGQLIDRIHVPGAPADVSTEVAWRTTAGSGIYLARVTARSEAGGSETHLVKMAIIR